MKVTTHFDLNADVKNEQSYTSPFRYVFMACTRITLSVLCVCVWRIVNVNSNINDEY